MNLIYLLILSCLLMSCASPHVSNPPPTATPTSPNRSVRHDHVAADDLKRVRHPEFVKTYHVGRKPSKNGQLMHEAHRVYQLEKSPRWNLSRSNPSLRSIGPVSGLKDSAFRPLPSDRQLRAETTRQRELSDALEITRRQTAEQLEVMKAKAAEQGHSAALLKRVSTELAQERKARAALENQLKASQPNTTDESDTSSSAKQLRQWGDQQP